MHLLVDCRKETYTDGLVKRKLSEKCKNGRQIMVSGMVSSSKEEEKVKEKHEKCKTEDWANCSFSQSPLKQPPFIFDIQKKLNKKE